MQIPRPRWSREWAGVARTDMGREAHDGPAESDVGSGAAAMILLNAENVTKHYGPEPVLAGVSLEVRPGEKISLVGPNGVGKTTLLKILAGREEPDAGIVELHSSARVGFLDQQPRFPSGRTVWEEARLSLEELTQMAHEAERLAHAISLAEDVSERQRLGERYDRLHHELLQRDGYHLDHKIERVLTGLGFEPSTFQQPVEQLSGGQQNRLLMVKLVLAEPDLMLLDEPSNHLDIDGTEWLEDFLLDSPCALIVVSHDRFFLDKVTRRTLELFRGTVESYPGNFTAYRRQKAERLEIQRRTYERQQTEIAKMQDFVRRHHYGQKHAQAEDRRKKLERIEPLEKPREIAAPPMAFPPASRSGDIALRVEGLAKSFDQPLFEDLSFDILRGEKWGILGPNGSGKTTLLLCLLGNLNPDAGRSAFGAAVKVGYFDQQLADLDENLSSLEAVRPLDKEMTEQPRRDLLARFGITGDIVHQRVGRLSGGERNRTALARLAASEANFLVLDEPTNHLDLWSRGSLEEALQRFDGSVLFVSHDRYFLNQVADHLLVCEGRRFRVIEGNYDTYLQMIREGLAGETRLRLDGAKPGSPRDSQDKKPAKESPPRRKRKFPYRKVTDLESEIAGREQRVSELHAAMTSPEVFRDGDRIKQAMTELAEQQQALQLLYEHWEEAVELNQA